MSGYYLMHRGWLDHPAFGGAREPFCRRAAWAWLIENAVYQDTRVGIGRKTVTLSRGQLSYSLRYLAGAWGWDAEKVRRFCLRLAEDGMIETDSEAGQMVITICNYDEYQLRTTSCETADEADVRQQRGSGEANKKERNTVLTLEADASRDVADEPADEAEPDLIKLDRADAVPVETLKAMASIWRDVCGDVLPVPRGLDKGRQAALRRRFSDTFGRSLDQWRDFCQRVRGSPFLTGENSSGWRADLDFMLKPKNANKLLEGGYDDRKPRQPAQQRRSAARSFEFDADSGLGGILDAVAPELDACGAGSGWRTH